MNGHSLFWLPLVLVWTLVRVLTVPAGLAGLAWWLLPDRWAHVVTGIAVLYLAGLALYTAVSARGHLRSLDRGTITIRNRTERHGRWDR